MALIDVRGLTFAYDGSYDNVFEDLSFQIDTGWRLGLVGRNGRGKTTLLRLLLGELNGGRHLSVPVPCDYFPAPIPDPDRETGQVLAQIGSGLEEWRLLRELSLLGLDEGVLWRHFSTLSGGERARVLLAPLFLREGRFPLIDEPTNHLDLEGRRMVSDYLQKKSGFILVSHDRAFLDGCVDHILALNKRDVQVRQGDFSTWWRDKERRDAWERAENAKHKRDIARLDEAARRTSAWSDQTERGKYATRNAGLRPDRGYVGHKAAKLMKRAKATEARRQEAAEQASELLKNIELTQALKLHPLRHPKSRLVEAVGYAPDYGDGPTCPPLSFTVERGERVALLGRNGSGKSSLLRCVAGESVPHRGMLTTASGLMVSYVSQDTSSLRGDLTAFAEAAEIDESLFKTILRKLNFSRVHLEKDLSDLSAGQRKKVLLARSLCQQAHLYVWDEPLNYVDLFSRMQLEDLLTEYRPTMLLVEHDRRFLEAVADKIITLP